MKTKDSVPKSRKNYYVDITAFVPFLMLLFTGIIMLMYHTGIPKSETILSRNGEYWLNTHIVFAVISFLMIVVHLSLHLNWFQRLFTAKRNEYWLRNLILVILFLATSLTSFIPLILDELKSANIVLGIHNKLGLLLVMFFLIHLLSYYKWLISMTKKISMNKSNKEVGLKGFKQGIITKKL